MIKKIIEFILNLFIKKGEVIIEPIKPLDYVIGQRTLIVPEIIVPDGDWLKYLSKPYDSQWVGSFDQLNCVSQAGINCLEAQLNFLLRNDLLPAEIDKSLEKFLDKDGYVKLSTRFTSKMAGTTRQGLRMTSFWDSVRKQGFVPLSAWPDPVGKFDWAEYYKEIPQPVKNLALNVLKVFEIKYEWVENGRCLEPILPKIKEALKQAPLHTAEPSCPRSYDGIQRPCGTCQSTHSRVIYKIDDFINVLDTYSPYIMKTSLSYRMPYIIKGIIKIRE